MQARVVLPRWPPCARAWHAPRSVLRACAAWRVASRPQRKVFNGSRARGDVALSPPPNAVVEVLNATTPAPAAWRHQHEKNNGSYAESEENLWSIWY